MIMVIKFGRNGVRGSADDHTPLRGAISVTMARLIVTGRNANVYGVSTRPKTAGFGWRIYGYSPCAGGAIRDSVLFV